MLLPVKVNLLLNLIPKHIIQVDYLVLLNNLMIFLRKKFMVIKKILHVKLELVKVLVSTTIFFFKKENSKFNNNNVLIFYLLIDVLNLTEEDISKYYNLIFFLIF